MESFGAGSESLSRIVTGGRSRAVFTKDRVKGMGDGETKADLV